MGTQVTEGGHKTLRLAIFAAVVALVGWFIVTSMEKHRAQAKSNCEVDLEASRRELDVAQRAVQADAETRTKETKRAVEVGTAGLVAERDTCRAELKSTQESQTKQFETFKEATNAQIAAIKALPEKQSEIFDAHMKAWREECSKMIERSEVLSRGRREECARAAETVINVCRDATPVAKK